MGWALRFHGVGNADAVELGNSMATIERDGQPWLTIDCGSEGLSAYLDYYGHPPRALFITHTHMDHVSGFERLFSRLYFDRTQRGRVAVYVPASVVPLLHQRVGDYPNALAEGGANFWEAFQLIPVGDWFWHRWVISSGMTACAWKRSRCATTGRVPPSACACRAVWCGAEIPAPLPNC